MALCLVGCMRLFCGCTQAAKRKRPSSTEDTPDTIALMPIRGRYVPHCVRRVSETAERLGRRIIHFSFCYLALRYA